MTIAAVYDQVREVNAALGVHVKSTLLIVTIADQLERQVNAALGVHARSTLAIVTLAAA